MCLSKKKRLRGRELSMMMITPQMTLISPHLLCLPFHPSLRIHSEQKRSSFSHTSKREGSIMKVHVAVVALPQQVFVCRRPRARHTLVRIVWAWRGGGIILHQSAGVSKGWLARHDVCCVDLSETSPDQLSPHTHISV